ncbi:SDR family NAD(P)-dependent oxidoreductase [Nonomuraea africana]|uniref:NAD(P)-dependent dehydrogenase (Short-subunit alcohol dehydrogenase family) n=1 Tax=Nonomuraea africana TaxID=46171 RepID=A0ABR9K845_9ACTN|nr:SDR family oxidoreductase [Nonomuraea africana]MBE1558194.1 NAD(P)-dependent dehydrogenase (short-subunit alcohol dehydrogenase family) [Nonomuraea africana]
MRTAAPRTAFVTGGASGIGRALALALAAKGVAVTVADLVAPDLPGMDLPEMDHVELDVTSPEAVAAAVQAVRRRHGRLDFVFNNAGIAVGGHTEELTLDHWNRTIDVNLRGVVHGVHAAYPIMIEQGHGHIVNTASLAGLVPAPLMLPYTATKHAVVGLSMALRAEAAAHGVRVSVVCPGFTDTPLLDNANPGLPYTETGAQARDAAVRAQGRLYPVESLAADIMRGVARNQALIVAPASGRLAWRAARLSPVGAIRAAALAIGRVSPPLKRT